VSSRGCRDLIDVLALLPEIILASVALLLVFLGFAVRRPGVLWAVAMAGTILALLVNLDLMGLSWSHAIGLDLWPVPGSQGSVLLPDLRLEVDGFATFFNMVF
jgi:hypothetical protein